MKRYTEADILQRIKARCDIRSQKVVAKEFGVSAPYMSLILRGSRPVPDSIADALGFVRARDLYIARPQTMERWPTLRNV